MAENKAKTDDKNDNENQHTEHDLDSNQKRDARRREAPSAAVVYEAIRREAESELTRPLPGLAFSALAAGLSMGFSFIAQALLYSYTPESAWRPIIASFGYSIGFLFVILGRQQLFTENTITVVLPLASRFSFHGLAVAARLWAVVLLGNLLGTLLMAWFIYYVMGTPAQIDALISLSKPVFDNSMGEMLIKAIPAGFIIAAVVWMLPNSRGFEFWMILVLTYLIGLGSFVHIIVGSTEAYLLWFAGQVQAAQVGLQFLLPAFVGNVIGGTVLFSLLAYGQVQDKV